MAFGSGGGNDVEIKIKVDAQGAITVLDSVGDEIAKVAKQSSDGGKQVNDFSKSWTEFTSKLNLAKQGFDVVAGAIGSLFEGIERGAAVDDVAQGFKNLTEQAGGLSDVFLNELKVATDGTIASFDLQKAAIDGVRAGAKPDEFVALAEAARALAEEAGTNLKDELDQLSLAFETGQVRMLKNKLGVIDLEAEKKKLADTLGVEVGQLTKEAEVFAGQQAILEASASTTERVGEITRDAGDKIAIMGSTLSDAADQALKGVAANEQLNQTLDDMVDFLAGVDWETWGSRLATVAGIVVGATENMIELGAAMAGLSTNLEATKAAGEMERFGASLKSLNDKIGAAASQQDLPKLKKQLLELFDKVKEGGPALKVFETALHNSTNAIMKQTEILPKGETAAEKYRKRVEELRKAFVGAGKDGAQKLNKDLEELQKTIDGLTSTDRFPELDRQIKEAMGGQNINSAEDLAKAVEKVGKAALAAGIPIDIVKDKINDAFGSTTGGLLETTAQSIDELFSEDFVEGAKKATNDVSKIIREGLFSAVSEGLSAALSGKTLTSKDYGQLTGGFLGNFADSFLPGSGQFVDALTQKLFSAFGSDSASTKARKEADKYFADIFDANRLGVVIDGQLQQIKDLVFQGNTLFGGDVSFAGGGAFDFLKTLPADAQAAFSGVGTAFEQFLGVSEDLGGQLAAVFANNIGGSLNNLQLLIQATGKTAEEMQSAVVDAFLNGELSANEALTAIQGINQVMTDGIPDGVGFVVQAFDNLKAAGVKGGRAVIDALKDIGFEAKENKQSLQDAMAQIAASGKFSAAEIQQVMDALAANGITSVEQLTNATTEQLLPVLALLENQKFPFAEAASEGQKLVDTLNNLPTKKTIDVEVRVKATGDTGALDKVSGGGSSFSGTGVKPGNSGNNAPRERPGQSGNGAGING